MTQRTVRKVVRVHWKLFKQALHKAEHKMVLRMTLFGHVAYYGLVSIEAHGNYRYVAAFVGVLIIAEALLDGNETA